MHAVSAEEVFYCLLAIFWLGMGRMILDILRYSRRR